MIQTLSEMIKNHPDNALAIGAQASEWMSYKSLRDLSDEVGHDLHNMGLGRGDRVAIVLPNGPGMAVAFVTLAQWLVAAPLNPSYKKDEFSFYISDLNAKAIVLLEDYNGPALEAARALGTAIVWLRPDKKCAGSFSLHCGNMI